MVDGFYLSSGGLLSEDPFFPIVFGSQTEVVDYGRNCALCRVTKVPEA
jgi:hypothetical protein